MDIKLDHADDVINMFGLEPLDLNRSIIHFSQDQLALNELGRDDFTNQHFDLALCQQQLFNEDNLDYQVKTLFDLCRIASEVRIFPLLKLKGELTPSLGPVMQAMQENNVGVEVKEVPFEFQKRGNAMLRVWNQSCVV